MDQDPQDNVGVTVEAKELARWMAGHCPGLRLDLAGAVALPCPLPHRDRWQAWVREGRHGDLEYLIRDPEARADPTLKNSWARSLLIFGQRYTEGWSAEEPDYAAGGPGPEGIPWTERVSRYARGADYHDVFLKDIRGLLADLKKEHFGLRAHASTDTGPYLEREYAWLAGLGFLGHNRCLIHEKMGSGIFLGVALTNLEITGLNPAGEPEVEPLFGTVPRRLHPPVMAPLDLCGSCSRCLEACPTGALDLHTGLDAHLCLSTWSIERQGQAPEGLAHLQGGLLFGCDICQQVCPWNQRAAERKTGDQAIPGEYQTLPEHAQLQLEDLAEISDQEFRERFRRTPIWRCHPEGLRRNARRVLSHLKDGLP